MWPNIVIFILYALYSCRRLTRTAKEKWKKSELHEVRVKRFWDFKWKIVEERIM